MHSSHRNAFDWRFMVQVGGGNGCMHSSLRWMGAFVRECVASGCVGKVHSTAQHSTAQHSTTQHSTAQHNTAQHNTTQHNTAQHSTAQHNTTQHNTAQHNTAQHSTTQKKRCHRHTTHRHTPPTLHLPIQESKRSQALFLLTSVVMRQQEPE
jgi:hypothetical protein